LLLGVELRMSGVVQERGGLRSGALQSLSPEGEK
jgi:hypothetical protein